MSSEYFDVLGIDVVSGRNFTRAERTADAGVAIVSETIARQLWPNGDGVGQLVRLEAPQSASPGGASLSAEARSAKVEPSRTLTVVGIVRDPRRDSGSPMVLPSDRSRERRRRRCSCASAATPSRRARRCSNASRASILP